MEVSILFYFHSVFNNYLHIDFMIDTHIIIFVVDLPLNRINCRMSTPVLEANFSLLQHLIYNMKLVSLNFVASNRKIYLVAFCVVHFFSLCKQQHKPHKECILNVEPAYYTMFNVILSLYL